MLGQKKRYLLVQLPSFGTVKASKLVFSQVNLLQFMSYKANIPCIFNDPDHGIIKQAK